MQRRRRRASVTVVMVLVHVVSAVAYGELSIEYTDVGHIEIPAMSPENPVIYDNDWFFDVTDFDYVLAKNSIGVIDLRGIVATRDMYFGSGGYTLQESIDDANEKIDLARASGLADVPDVTPGASLLLVEPPSGQVDDTAAVPTAGSNLIVAEAHQASPEHPLLVHIGGQATSLANAVLQDPSIRPNIIAIGLGAGYNGKDEWAYFVAKKTVPNIVYEWLNNAVDFGGHIVGVQWPDERWLLTPDNPLCNANKTKYYQGGWMRDHATRPLDGSMLVYTFEHRIFQHAERRIVNSPPFNYSVTSGDTFDALWLGDYDIPKMADAFFNTFMDPCVYDPGSCAIPSPSNLTATVMGAGIAVELTWQDNSSDPQEAGFIIERKPWGGVAEWHELGRTSPNVTSYTDTDALYGMVNYTYRVGATTE